MSTRRVVCVVIAAGACGRIDFDSGAARDAAHGDGAVDVASFVPPGAIAWWKLDEGTGTIVNDSIGTADGTLVTGPTGLPTWTIGHLGEGLDFSGNGDSVQFGVPPALLDLPAVSVAAWVQPDGVTVLDQCILDHGNTGVGWVFAISYEALGDITFFGIYPTDEVLHASSASLVPTGVWTHVIATWDGGPLGSGIHLYANGDEVAYAHTTDATGTRADESTASFSINCSNGGTSGLGGILDDIRVWNRALSPTEAHALYEATK